MLGTTTTSSSRFAALAALLAAACGAPAPPSGGDIDGAPLPPDGGPPDSGPPDAALDASPDAGSSPLVVARDEARAALAAVELSRDALSADARTGAEFVELGQITTRLDAVIGEKIGSPIEIAGVIGEKSMGTLALPVPAVPAMMIAQQLRRAVGDIEALLGGTTWSSSTDPLLAALANDLTTLHDRLITLHDILWARFRELVTSVSGTAFPEVTPYADAHAVDIVRSSNVVRMVVEGRDAADPTATLDVDCVEYTPTLRVVDEETGIEILRSTNAPGPVWSTRLDVGHDDPRPLRVEITLTDVTRWSTCDVTITGDRHVRGTAEPIDGGENREIAALASAWSSHVSSLESHIASLRTAGTIDGGRLDALERFVQEASAAASRLRRLDTATAIQAEDYELDALVVTVIVALSNQLGLDPELAADPTIAGGLDGLESALHGMLDQAAPMHRGPSA